MTLTQAAVFTKKFLLGLGIFLFLFILVWGGYSYYKAYIYKPPAAPEPQPDFKFGKLPFINLEPNPISSDNYTYSIDTETGNLPSDFPKLIKVYLIPQAVAGFLAPDRAKTVANSLNFLNGPNIVSPNVYEFTDELGGKMVINIDTGNFSYQHNIASPSAEIASQPLPNESALGNNFKNFLSSTGLLKPELTNGRTFVNYENGNPVTANQADVSIWQNDIEEYEIVTPQYNKSLINSLVLKAEKDADKFAAMNYTYWPIDKENFATYPLKPVKTAFEELQQGRGYVSREPDDFNVSISNVKLAYLLTEKYSPYLQPVFVFSGIDFVGYVPAVPDEYISN